MAEYTTGVLYDYSTMETYNFKTGNVWNGIINAASIDYTKQETYHFTNNFGHVNIQTAFGYDYTTKTIYNFQDNENPDELDKSDHKETPLKGEISIIDISNEIMPQVLSYTYTGRSIKGRIYGNVNYDGNNKKGILIRLYNTATSQYEDYTYTDKDGNYQFYIDDIDTVYTVEATDQSLKYNIQVKAYTLPEPYAIVGTRDLGNDRYAVLPNTREITI